MRYRPGPGRCRCCAQGLEAEWRSTELRRLCLDGFRGSLARRTLQSAMNVGEFREKGVQCIQDAVKLDEAGKFAEAVKRYQEGVEQLIAFIRCESGNAPILGRHQPLLSAPHTPPRVFCADANLRPGRRLGGDGLGASQPRRHELAGAGDFGEHAPTPSESAHAYPGPGRGLCPRRSSSL